MKKYILILLLIFTLLLTACNKKPNDESEDDIPMKPMLMFIIDEGIANAEMIPYFTTNEEKLFETLDVIFDTLSPLKEKYQVSYLVYPHYYYSQRGFGEGSPSEGINRFSPYFKRVLSYFEEKGELIYLEAYSSGIYTNQNTELGTLPLVPIHYGTAEKPKGTSMDVEAIKALKEAFPNTFMGIRFHELVGTDQAQNHYVGPNNVAHGFPVNFNAIKAFVDVCKEAGLELVWGDHSFDDIYTESKKEQWLESIRYARTTLKKQLILNSSNNSWGISKSIKMEPFLREEDREFAKLGFSVQSWFWQESDVSSMNTLKKPRWYEFAYMDMPVELMVSSTIEAMRQGSVLVQFEPVSYFFNAGIHGTNESYRGFVEDKMDFSPRIGLLRFIHLLLEEDVKDIPGPTSFYSTSEGLLKSNDENNPPEKYFQSTFIFKDNNKWRYFDFFNYSEYNKTDDNLYRFNEDYFDEALFIQRLNITFSKSDEILVINKNNNKYTGHIYTKYNTKIKELNSTFNNIDGEIIDVITGNFIRKFVNKSDSDPDEIVLVIKKDDVISLKLYHAIDDPNLIETYHNFTYVEHANSDNLLIDIFGFNNIDNYDNNKLLSFRTRNAIYFDSTRTIDTPLLASYNNNELNINNQTFELPGDIIHLSVMDHDLDSSDDCVVIYKKNDNYYMTFIDYLNGTFYLNNQEILIGENNIDKLFALSQGTYYNASIFLP